MFREPNTLYITPRYTVTHYNLIHCEYCLVTQKIYERKCNFGQKY